MQTKDVLYDLLMSKTCSQEFYNSMMVRMLNPVARDLFKKFRDKEEQNIVRIRKQFLLLESKPLIFKAFIRN